MPWRRRSTSPAERQAKSRKQRLRAGSVRITLIVPAHVRDGLAGLADRDHVMQATVLEGLLDTARSRADARVRDAQSAINLEWALIALAWVEELIASGDARQAADFAAATRKDIMAGRTGESG